MKIAATQLDLSAQHAASSRFRETESLRTWTGDRRPDFEGQGSGTLPRDTVRISDAGRSAVEAQETKETSERQDGIDKDPKLSLIRRMIEMIAGRSIKVLDLRDLQAALEGSDEMAAGGASPGNPSSPAGFGVEYDHQAIYEEHEEVQFQAQGLVKTTDGQEIRFSLSFSLSRDYREEVSEQLRLGDAVRKDPLVLSFDGSSAQLTSNRFSFDLDGDGKKESLPGLAGGSGFLVFDANGNGRVDDGRELFGPASGDGFADLARLDGDGNGWIDESDTAFGKLALWRPGQGMTSLKDAGVGALGLARIATPYSMNDAGNASLGQLRSSGVYLKENGSAGLIQQIDLTA